MSSEITMWHYSIDGEKFGPVSTPELRRLANIGQLAPTDLVWKDGLTDWIPANRIKDLFPAGATGKPRANAPSGDGTGVSPTALITEGAGKMTEEAGKMLEHVGRFSTQMHDISSSAPENASMNQRRYVDNGVNEEDEPPIRRRTKSGSRLSGFLVFITMVAWGGLLVVVCGGGLMFIGMLNNATTVMQEAAAGAIFSTIFIGLYVLVRCIEKLTIAVDRILARRSC